MLRRVLLVLVAGSAVALVPWTVYLSLTLPVTFDTSAWRWSWVGFDIALACCLAVAAWLGLRRRRAAVTALACTAALLCCDAWFDVTLDWNAADRWTSLAMALLVEVPLAVLLLGRARELTAGGMPRRPLTVADVELQTDPLFTTLRAAVAEGPADTATLAAHLGQDSAEIAPRLDRLAAAGHLRRAADGRWHALSLTLAEPVLDDLDEPDRTRLRAFYDAKFARELRLLAWAVDRRGDFGPWGRGHRAKTHLTEAELRAFNAEYEELLDRYCLLRNGPRPGTREIAVRWYAFPAPEVH